jgi:uncharacterized protein
MALEIRPNCEYCDKDLPAGSTEARICSYECTFCAACVETKLRGVCPNCGGVSLTKRPASSKRVHLSHDLADIAALTARIAGIDPEDR